MNTGRLDNKLAENLHFQITDGVIYVAGTWKLDVHAMMNVFGDKAKSFTNPPIQCILKLSQKLTLRNLQYFKRRSSRHEPNHHLL